MKSCLAVLVLSFFFSTFAFSSENGNATGAVVFGMDGLSLLDLPPKGGIYLMNFTKHFKSSKIVDNDGRDALPGAELDVLLNTARISTFFDTEFLGADYVAFEMFPTLVRSELRYGGNTESKTGLADLAIDPLAMAWRTPKSNIGIATTFIMPSGEYDQDETINIGNNHFTWLPQVFYQRYIGDGWGDFSLHAAYEHNWANPQGLRNQINPNGEKYKSGDVFHTEMALTKYLGNWRVGASVLAGYQLTDDEIIGDDFSNEVLRNNLDGNRYKKATVGLAAMYQVGGIMPISINYTRDVYARNTVEGDSLVFRVILPLKFF